MEPKKKKINKKKETIKVFRPKCLPFACANILAILFVFISPVKKFLPVNFEFENSKGYDYRKDTQCHVECPCNVIGMALNSARN